MTEIRGGLELKAGAGSGDGHGFETDPTSLALKRSADQARVMELEAENARLLRLVGELLVVNQQLRERIAS
jgi:hypothetical protein